MVNIVLRLVREVADRHLRFLHRRERVEQPSVAPRAKSRHVGELFFDKLNFDFVVTLTRKTNTVRHTYCDIMDWQVFPGCPD